MVKGTDIGAEVMERNVGGEIEAESGGDRTISVGTGTKATKTTATMKGKEWAKGATGKGGPKGLEGLEVLEGEEEVETKGEGVGATTTIDPMDMLCNNVIFGYCHVNLFKPPAPLKFREYNKQPLVEMRVKKFVVSIGSTNVHPFAQNNMLPLVISKDDVEAECYELNLNVEKAPMLKLKAGVVEKGGYGLKFAGGWHHHQAMEILQEKSKDVVTGLWDKFADKQKVLGETEVGGKKRGMLEEKIEELEAKLKGEKEVEMNISVWGMVLYEESGF